MRVKIGHNELREALKESNYSDKFLYGLEEPKYKNPDGLVLDLSSVGTINHFYNLTSIIRYHYLHSLKTMIVNSSLDEAFSYTYSVTGKFNWKDELYITKEGFGLLYNIISFLNTMPHSCYFHWNAKILAARFLDYIDSLRDKANYSTVKEGCDGDRWVKASNAQARQLELFLSLYYNDIRTASKFIECYDWDVMISLKKDADAGTSPISFVYNSNEKLLYHDFIWGIDKYKNEKIDSIAKKLQLELV